MSSLNTASSPQVQSQLLALVDALVSECRQGTHPVATLDTLLEKDLGLDSLARVELLARVEQRFGIELAAGLIDAAQSPRDILTALFEGHQAGVVSSEISQPLATQISDGLPVDAVSLIEVLDWHCARHPEREHILFYNAEAQTETLSYRALHEAAGRVARGLAELGVKPGQCVAMMLPSGLDFFRCFMGILYAGAVPVPMYPPARPNQIEEHLKRQAAILRNCAAPVLVTFEQVRTLTKALSGLSPALISLTTVPALAAAGPGTSLRVDPEGLALVQYTSGSTGAPKGVSLSHRNLLANIRAWGEVAQIDSSDVCVSWLPLYHDMGLIGTWMGSLYHAVPLVLMSPLDFLAHPERWLWAIHRHRGTVSAAPNFAFDLCVKRLAGRSLEGLDLSSWRLAANGAEPVSAETLARFAETFAPYGLRANILAPVYGLAECSVGLAVPPLERGVRVDRVSRDDFSARGKATPVQTDASGTSESTLSFVACGPPLPAHQVRVIDEHGHALPERHVGQLEFRGPSTTSGYFRNPEADRELFDGDWLRSGDYAYLADGEIFITGRAKDMIIRAGRNYYPYDLESAVGSLHGVRKGCVAVFGVMDPKHGIEKLVVVAETRESDPSARARIEHEIRSAAVEVMGLPPDEIVLSGPNAVLKTSSGKIRRAAIREAYLGGTLGVQLDSGLRQAVRLYRDGFTGHLRKALNAVTRRLYGFWVWSWFALLLIPAVIAIMVMPTLGRRWAVCHTLAKAFITLSGCKLEVRGNEAVLAQPGVIVANHASYIDGFVLAAALSTPVRFVAKAEFVHNRMLSTLFRRMETQFVERFESSKGLEDVRRITQLAGEQPPLLFFAEGTFTAQPGLRPFRLGAFRAATDAGVPIVPISLSGTRDVLRDGSAWPNIGTMRVTIGEAIATTPGADWREIVALRDRARAEVLAHCGEFPVDHF